MPATMTNEGLDALTRFVLRVNPTLTAKLGLYTNNFTIELGSRMIDLVECALPGYARKNLPGPDWSGSTVAGVSTYASVVYDFVLGAYVAPQVQIYGYFVAAQEGNKLLWGQRFSPSFVVPFTGATCHVALQYVDQPC